ncbi:ion transporter [Anaerococcus sp. AGMB00486]|uniref:Ion transporter n=1 Tax=Anaerococcus faecalis TaxID=2742993 RepID=A0ABX2NBR7_9FIRM|nr:MULTISPECIES: ion transporter [Anaerococcus]MDY3006351.1 ion transporter [Anaerococcus porci]NVF12139.1 ion transporter [Anaerococcus faecalis]
MKDTKVRQLGFQNIGVSLSYTFLMLISFFKDFNTSGITIMFSTMLIFGIIDKIFIEKDFESNLSKIFAWILLIAFIIIVIANFESLFK